MKKVLTILLTQVLIATGLYAQTQQDLRDSVSIISEQLQLHPKNIELLMKKAALNIELEKWEAALDDYSTVLDIQPSNLTALHFRAFVNQHLDRYAFARADYEKVLMYEPRHLPSLMGLVLTNCADGHTTEAYDGANRLVEMFPESACAYDVRSDVEQKLNLTTAAIDDIEKAIELEEESMKRRKVSRLSFDDDMVSYQMRAFMLYLDEGNKSKAKNRLQYLADKGIPKAALADYYKMLQTKR